MTQQLYGTVSAVDYATCRVRVRIPERDNLETYWLHLPQLNTVGVQRRPILPAIGEQVNILLNDDGVNGTVCGGIYHTGNPPPISDPDTDYVRFADGTTVTYNQASHALNITGPASVTVIAQQVTVKADAVTLDTPQTTCTGDMTVQGLLTYQGGLAGSGGSGAAATINGNVQVNGNINATGSIMDAGGNSNHHSH